VTPLHGVRVFDVVQPGSPREITGSLAERLTLWDARERAMTAEGTAPSAAPPGGSSDAPPEPQGGPDPAS
jgi:hypothetical protein